MEKREPYYSVGGNVIWCNQFGNLEFGATTVENSMEIPQKTKNRTSI